MSIDSILGKPGEPVACKIYPNFNVAMHWFPTDAKTGTPCICGKTIKKRR